MENVNKNEPNLWSVVMDVDVQSEDIRLLLIYQLSHTSYC